MTKEIRYFEDLRADKTEAVFALILEKARVSGIKKAVIASTTGSVARRAIEYFRGSGLRLVFVPHQFDFSAKDGNRFGQELDSTLSALEAIRERRSVRSFADRPVEGWKREAILDAAASAPSAHGKRPWRFAVLDDRELASKIVERLPWFAPAMKSDFNLLVLGEPAACVNREYWTVDCAAATENALLAARALGLGAVWMGISPVEANVEAFSSAVKIPEGLVPFSLAAIGYPEGAEAPREPGRARGQDCLIAL
jgi:nitroreductase